MDQQQNRFLPTQQRAASVAPATFNSKERTVEVVWTTGARVRRRDWWTDQSYDEELVVDANAIDLTRLNTGGAPVLNTHSSYSLDDQIGVVDRAWVQGGEGRAVLRLSERDEVAGIVRDIEAGLIKNISVGYNVRKYEIVSAANRSDGGTVPLYRAVDWEPAEISFVPIPADAMSSTRSDSLRGSPCEFIETRAAGATQSPTVGASAEPLNSGEISMTPEEIAAAAEAQRAATAAAAETAAAATLAQQAEQTRSADITDLCARHGVAQLAAGMIRAGNSVEQARGAVLEELARRDAAQGGHRNLGRIETVRDEMQVRLAGIEQAILHRVAPATQLDDNGRQYRGMSLLEIGRDFLEAHGVQTRGMARMELAGTILHFRAGGMMGTSDFSSLFANVANKRLRGAYDENPGSYAMWARRAPNAPDFKSMKVVQLSGAPDLLQVNEHGEFKVGNLTDGAENYAVLTYGRIVSLTRQAIVNDDLRAFERLVSAFGFAARRLENRTVYSQLTANANLADGIALFEAATHKNLGTGAGSALQFSSLATARTAMRVQKGLASEELNLAPSYLILPAALEQTAYQLTSSNYVPATKAEVNEFRTGGRTALTPVIEPVLDANSATAWYLASESSQVDTVEYCYLDDAEGPVIESEVGFEVDGVSYKCRLDFAAKAVDYRGLYKANGA
ncbi:MAG: prohead protease/major capsid protein fusion protein [Burkholderiaceae bacterium]